MWPSGREEAATWVGCRGHVGRPTLSGVEAGSPPAMWVSVCSLTGTTLRLLMVSPFGVAMTAMSDSYPLPNPRVNCASRRGTVPASQPYCGRAVSDVAHLQT